MTAQTIHTTAGSVFANPARPARLRLWLTWLRNLSVQIELDPHLANDIGHNSYGAPVLPQSWTQAPRYFPEARQQPDPAMEIERCERGYDAPVLAASWTQAVREAAGRPGWLQRVIGAVSGLRDAFASDRLEILDRHIARDIGTGFEKVSFKEFRRGGGGYE